MSAIFLAVLELSFKASFLILAVAILRLVLQKAPRRIICALWLLVGLRLIVPFSVESALSLVPSAPNFGSESAEAEIIPEPTPQTAFTPSTEADLSLPQTAPNTQITIPTEPPQLPAAERLPEPEASEPPAAKPLPSRENVASIVWLSGLGAMLIYLALSFVFLHRSLREAVPAGNGVWKCGAVSSPFVLGIFKPRVYISYGMSPEQTEYVLAHERSHIARRDHWTKLIGFLILSVHWFNPLVWLGYVLLCRDIELACDERVVRSMDEMERKAYSLALLQCAVKASPLAACPLAFGEVGVKQRIKSVLSYKKPTVWIILVAIIGGIAAGVFFLTDPKVTKLDCPVEVEAAIYDYLDTNASFRSYNVDKVTERNEYLYSFAFTGKLSRSHNADYFAKLGYFRAQRDVSTVYYVYSIDGQWIVTQEFSDIPSHILRGEEAAAEAPPTYDCPDMVLETYKRWVKAMSDGTGDFEVYRELTYLGEGVEPSSMGISMSDILTDEIQSVSKVNDYLYEVKSIYTLKHSDKEYAAQRFVGYINNKWMLMHYDLVPESLQVGLECFEHYTWDENGELVILPPNAVQGVELSVEAHLVDRMRFYLPAMHSTGLYDTILGFSGGGVPIYYADGTLCGYAELSYHMKPEFEEGKIVSAADGMNRAAFVSDFEAIEQSVPCAIAQYSQDYRDETLENAYKYTQSPTDYWYVVFAVEGSDFCYCIKLDCGYFSREEAIDIAGSVSFGENAFESFNDYERVYWPIIDAYATALALNKSPAELSQMGLAPIMSAAASYSEGNPMDNVGYAIRNLDGKKHPELLIGDMSGDSLFSKMIFELYCLDGGEPRKVFSSTERSRYYYSGEKSYLHESSTAAGETSSLVYTYDREKLVDGREILGDRGMWTLSAGLTPLSAIIPEAVVPVNLGPVPYVEAETIIDGSLAVCREGQWEYFSIPKLPEIAAIAASIVNSGHMAEYSEAEAQAREEATRNTDYAKHLILTARDADYELCFTQDELGIVVIMETPSFEQHYRITDSAQEEQARLLMIYAPQKVFVDNSDNEEYVFTSGLQLGLSYSEVVKLMGVPDVIEDAGPGLDEDYRILALHYLNEATLYMDAYMGLIDEAYLEYIQIFGGNIKTSRYLSCGASEAQAYSIYGIRASDIEGSSAPFHRDMSLAVDEYYTSAFALSSGNKSAPVMLFLFAKDVTGLESLQCISLFRPPVIDCGRPALAPPHGGSITAQAGKELRADTNGDGELEYISLEEDGKLRINGKLFDTGASEGAVLGFTDLDSRDTLLEIVISGSGENVNSFFFNWKGGELISLGSIPTPIDEIEFSERYVSAAFPCDILQGWKLFGHWVLQDGELMLTNGMNSGMHYLFTRSSYELNEQGEPVVHRLKDSIVVYDGNEKPTNREVLPADSTIALMGCDNVEWLRIMSDNGASYWLHVANGMVDTPNGPRPIGEIIEGLA